MNYLPQILKFVFVTHHFNLLELYSEIKDIAVIDNKLKGRYCGTNETKLTQNYTTYLSTKILIKNKTPAHIEIGTLFGGSAISRAITLTRLNRQKHKIFVIDPFEGYYGQRKDPVSSLGVTKKLFLKNIENLGLNKSSFKIIKKYSQDVNLIVFDKYSVLTLMIDGDHSYDGIKNDWIKYSNLVVRGGFVIIDDYGHPAWPAIKKFIDTKLKENKNKWRKYIKFGDTLVLQKIT